MEKTLRDDAKKAAEEVGVPLTTVVNGMLRQFVRDKEITFSAYPMPKPEKIAEWERISDEMDRHPEKSLVFNGTDEFIEYMNKIWTGPKKSRVKKAR